MATALSWQFLSSDIEKWTFNNESILKTTTSNFNFDRERKRNSKIFGRLKFFSLINYDKHTNIVKCINKALKIKKEHNILKYFLLNFWALIKTFTQNILLANRIYLLFFLLN